MTGHSLKGRNRILKPVNNETADIRLSITKESVYTVFEMRCAWSMMVTEMTKMPMKIRVKPSPIHSMAIILLLSAEISPNPMTMDLVGKRWAMPQIRGIDEPT